MHRKRVLIIQIQMFVAIIFEQLSIMGKFHIDDTKSFSLKSCSCLKGNDRTHKGTL